MKHLSDITLIMVAGSYTRLAHRALEDVFDRFSFDRFMVFSNEAMPCINTYPVHVRTPGEAAETLFERSGPLVETNWAMVMQWDGYPVNPEAWTDEFRRFDFIGAVWPWYTELTVGNNGFCLYSRKMLDAVRGVAEIMGDGPDDILICRELRHEIEARFGVAFADEATADQFSTEHGPSGWKSLGFHGVWNMLRFLDDDQIKERLSLMTGEQWRTQQIDTMSYRALTDGRRDLYRWMLKERQRVLSCPIGLPKASLCCS